mmetsp:Transcript_46801/g.94425  ORF Transcript_46801/g.94425 Transcript_46801/m.94425 type:complete len:128 (-) Transcript_46801:108-491(-)
MVLSVDPVDNPKDEGASVAEEEVPLENEGGGAENRVFSRAAASSKELTSSAFDALGSDIAIAAADAANIARRLMLEGRRLSSLFLQAEGRTPNWWCRETRVVMRNDDTTVISANSLLTWRSLILMGI